MQAHLLREGRVTRAAREHAQLLKVWTTGKAKGVRELVQAHSESTWDDLPRAVSIDESARKKLGAVDALVSFASSGVRIMPKTYQSFVRAVSAGTRSIALSHSGVPEKRLRMKSMNNLTFIVPR